MKATIGSLALIAVLLVTGINAQAFPTVYPTGRTIYDPQNAYNGYTLYFTRGDPQHRVLLIDMQGDIVHSWNRPGYTLGYAEPLLNGNVLIKAYKQGVGSGLVELDWESNVVWEFFDENHSFIHHDFERLENGNTLILCKQHIDVPEISSETLEDDYIIEVNPQGIIVWEWHTYEHFDEFGFTAEAKQLIADAGGDWAHANSINCLPGSISRKELILVSQRKTNTIFVLSKDTGEIVWQIGPNDNQTLGQHNAQMIPEDLPGANNILVFDNGGIVGYPMEARLYSRVVEINPWSKKTVWKYQANNSGLSNLTFFSSIVSGAQRLPNGNTLIVEGENGRFFEVTRDFEIVWEYVSPFFFWLNNVYINKVYRAHRVGLDWPQGELDVSPEKTERRVCNRKMYRPDEFH